MKSPSVSVVVVSFNTCEKLAACLRAIEPDHEILVVDNASSDGSPEMVAKEFPHVRLIRNSENLGFGPANNQGAIQASHALVLYLNSDAYAFPGAIQRLSKVFEDASIVAAGGRLLNPDGSLQLSSANRLTLWAVFCEQYYLEKLFKDSSLFNPYWNTRRLQELPCPADTEQVMGACLMVRNGFEPFDERFFLYCEDTDLCLRLRRHGRIVYVKDASFTHDLGSSSASDPLRGVARYNRGKEFYFAIHQGAFASFVCRMFDSKGAFLRSIYWGAKSLLRHDQKARELSRGFWRLGWNAFIGRTGC